MKTPVHHLGDNFLLAYVQGELETAWELVAATHLALCPVCRRTVARYEAIGGDVLDEIAPVSLTDVAHPIAAISGVPQQPSALTGDKSQTAAPRPILPEPLRSIVGGDASEIPWAKIGGGVRQHIVVESETATARLLHVPAACAVPEHTHGGLELTLVLDGEFRDEAQFFGCGDVQTADETVHHHPVAGLDKPCICLAVTDASLKFQDLVPRLAQRFLRI